MITTQSLILLDPVLALLGALLVQRGPRPRFGPLAVHLITALAIGGAHLLVAVVLFLQTSSQPGDFIGLAGVGMIEVWVALISAVPAAFLAGTAVGTTAHRAAWQRVAAGLFAVVASWGATVAVIVFMGQT